MPWQDARSLAYKVSDLFTPNAPLKTKVWRCTKFLDQGNEGACFPPGTWVRMADGSQRRIEDVQLLEEVVTAEGGTGQVLQTMVRPYEGNLLVVKLRGHHPVRATGKHPFLTQRGYVATKDLEVGDYVAVTRFAGKSEAIQVNVLGTAKVAAYRHRGAKAGEVNTGGVTSVVTEMPLSIRFSWQMGRILGLYAAEGHTTENKVVWTFHEDEETTLAGELIALLRDVLHVEARIQHRKNNKAINVVAYGKPWRVLFSLLVPGTSKHGDKHLSKHVTAGNPEFLDGVLGGWLDGDGHRRRTCVEGVTVSKQLALDMHAIANDLGKRPTIGTRKPVQNSAAKTRQHSWSITIPEGGGTNVMKQDDQAVWRKVMSIDPKPYQGWVFNLHVEGAESYVADGLGVHNCTGFAVSHELVAQPVVVKKGVDNTFAREQIYWEAQKIDPFDGGAYPGAIPLMEGSTVLAAMKVAKNLGYITEYRWAFGIEDVKQAISQLGPVVLGIKWYEGMAQPSPCGMLHPTGEIRGGHAILAKGIRVKRQTIVLHNSWGEGWGDNGTAEIHWDDLDFLLKKGGDAAIPVTRKRPT